MTAKMMMMKKMKRVWRRKMMMKKNEMSDWMKIRMNQSDALQVEKNETTEECSKEDNMVKCCYR